MKQASEIVRLEKWIARLQKQIASLKEDRDRWRELSEDYKRWWLES